MDTTIETIEQRVIEFVQTRDYVSFVEMTGFLAKQGMSVDGDMALAVGENLVVWAGMSREACQLLENMLTSHQIYAHPCHAMVYLIDGAMPDLPVVKPRARTKPKRPHWLPVTLRTVPLPAGQGKQSQVKATVQTGE